MNQDTVQSEKSDTKARLVDLIEQLSHPERISLLEQIKAYISGKKIEKRAHERTKCSLPINYISLLEMVTDYANDISPSGIFMQTDVDLDVGDEIFLRINFSENMNPFQIPAEVVRASSRGVGLRFQFKSQVQKAIVTSLIESLKEMRKRIDST